jgi:hypothetical protein
MSRYILIRRLRGPAFLLLVGVNALLAQANILGWSESWPFYLILAGVLLLAERAALASEGYPQFPGTPYAGANAAGGAQTAAGQASQDASSTETALVAKRHQGFDNDADGGQQ